MILITGATGKLGSKVIETLLKNKVPAGQIAALVRDEAKAADLEAQGIDLRVGNYDDQASLVAAMQGVDRVLLVSALDRDRFLQQHKNVIDAAKSAGIKCVAYTSHCLADRHTLVNKLLLSHFETEDYLKDSGLNYIIFRNILYMDSMATFIIGGRQALQSGITLPAGEGNASYALRADEAEAIGNVLSAGNCDSRVYDFTGSRLYSFYDVAEALTELAGIPVKYNPVEADVYRAQGIAKGTPDYVLDATISFVTDIKNGQESTITNDLEQALGRKPTGLKAGLKVLLEL